MKYFKTLTLSCAMGALLINTGCSKEPLETAKAAPTSTVETTTVYLNAPVGVAYPTQTLPVGVSDYETVTAMTFAEATIQTPDGVQVNGSAELLTFNGVDVPGVTMLRVDEQLIPAYDLSISVVSAQEASDRMMPVTSGMICSIIAAQAYQTEYARILAENNVLCDVCAWVVAETAYNNCMNGG